jgi:branched-chain amino acid transport system substrate-binding protein
VWPMLSAATRSLAAFFLLLGGLVVGCRPPALEKVVIVSSLPRTGQARQTSEAIVRGIRLAIDEAGGRVGSFEVQYLDLDNASVATGRWTSEGEAANARRAVHDPNVVAVIGTLNSAAARVSLPILNYADLLMVSPANTAVGLTKPGLGQPGEPAIYRPSGRLNFIRVIPADDVQGPLAADWAFGRGLRRVCVVDDGGVYGRGVASMFADRCRQHGMPLLLHESIDPQAAEFRSFVAAITAADPDLVYFGGSTQTKGGQLARDLAAAGCEAVLLVPDGCLNQAFIDAAGPAAVEGRCFATFGGPSPDRPTARGAAFAAAYRQRFGNSPEPSAFCGYEAAGVVLQAIAAAGSRTRRTITTAALATADYDGVLGRWSVDANGDTTLRELSVSVVRDGRFVHEEMIPATGMGGRRGGG